MEDLQKKQKKTTFITGMFSLKCKYLQWNSNIAETLASFGNIDNEMCVDIIGEIFANINSMLWGNI